MKSTIDIKTELFKNGYCIIPDVLTNDEVQYAKSLFKEWQSKIPNHDKIHKSVNPHGIYKFHEAGHARHSWFIRTRPNIINIYKHLWNTPNLVVSFDSCCYIPKNCTLKDKCWTHTDQAPNSKGLQCYQGLVGLTDNRERTLVVYEGTHRIHEKYFRERNIKSSQNWQLIDETFLESIKDRKRVLHIPAGALAIWDSRVFHQNQYGKLNSEERYVQYVCYLPKSHPKNTVTMIEKRRKYYNERRTTSHWPVPVRVNGLQPQTFGDPERSIDYNKLEPPDLDDLEEEIYKII